MTEELLSHAMVEIGHGDPLPGAVPTASRTKSVYMGMKSSRIAKCLDDRYHAGAEIFLLEDGSIHELS